MQFLASATQQQQQQQQQQQKQQHIHTVPTFCHSNNINNFSFDNFNVALIYIVTTSDNVTS